MLGLSEFREFFLLNPFERFFRPSGSVFVLSTHGFLGSLRGETAGADHFQGAKTGAAEQEVPNSSE